MSGDPETLAADMDCNSFFDLVEDLLLDFPEDSKNSNTTDYALVGDTFAPYSLLDPNPAAELSIPYEDIVQMEWLSTFMEDSFSVGRDSLALENGQIPLADEVAAEVAPIQFHLTSPISVLESSSSSSSSSEGTKIPPISPDNGRGCGRARSKRPRPSAFSSGSGTFTNVLGVCVSTSVSRGEKFNDSSVVQKKKKRNIKTSGEVDRDVEVTPPQSQTGIRKCQHCEITKTPQWRAGPMGPKTLCNACGVRYKSGRLYPEYRPAASPTFVPSLHSNSHKKVLEMRTTTTDDIPSTSACYSQPELIPNKDAMLEEYIQGRDLST